METWHSPAGSLLLGRYPYDTEDRGLRAWNGADILLAGHLATFAAGRFLNVLVVNDHFGALTCAALQMGHAVWWQSDSWLSRAACRENMSRNGLAEANLVYLNSLSPFDFTDWSPDLVLMQVPKSTLMLEFQLGFLADSLAGGTSGIPVCGGGMTRDIHNSTVDLFATLVGPTTTSLSAHKARLIHSRFDSAARPVRALWPRVVALNEPGLPTLEVANYAGVFSASGHDQGSLLLLHYLADTAAGLLAVESRAPTTAAASIIDCACGNGLLGIAAARLFPEASLVCTDESFMAVESTRAGFTRNGMADRAQFLWTDCLLGVDSGSADLVLCNPPFHLRQTQTLAIAQRMFQHAARCLKSDGTLLVVANRHLGHHRNLQRHFGSVRIVRENERYVVIAARKQSRPRHAGILRATILQ